MKKFLIYIIYLLILLLSFIYISINYLFEKEKSYLILDSNNIWSLNDDEIKQTNNKKLKKLNYSDVKIYTSDSEFNGYIDSDKYYLYNENYELISKKPQTFILTGANTFKNYANLITFNLTESDYKIVEEVLNSNNLSYDYENSYIKKARLYNDTYLYSIHTRVQSNYDYSVIFLYKNEKSDILYIRDLIKQTNVDRKSTLYGIVDINNDNKLEIILLSDIAGSAGYECYSLYEYNEKLGKYEPTIDCEEE